MPVQCLSPYTGDREPVAPADPIRDHPSRARKVVVTEEKKMWREAKDVLGARPFRDGVLILHRELSKHRI